MTGERGTTIDRVFTHSVSSFLSRSPIPTVSFWVVMVIPLFSSVSLTEGFSSSDDRNPSESHPPRTTPVESVLCRNQVFRRQVVPGTLGRKATRRETETKRRLSTLDTLTTDHPPDLFSYFLPLLPRYLPVRDYISEPRWSVGRARVPLGRGSSRCAPREVGMKDQIIFPYSSSLMVPVSETWVGPSSETSSDSDTRRGKSLVQGRPGDSTNMYQRCGRKEREGVRRNRNRTSHKGVPCFGAEGPVQTARVISARPRGRLRVRRGTL